MRRENERLRAELKAAITDVFTRNHVRYGHRRVHHALVKAGWRIARKTVLSLMRGLGLVCRAIRRRDHVSIEVTQARSPRTCCSRNSPPTRRTRSGSLT
ncbi:IS3 family transposase [Amycolatopsis sp. NPDC051373]|uniref:IS3 family transposase n=1 Tax=Amycolatopsis sp. NPDC051373 TaxID=3155801 RepID=UPI00345100C7